ncbi:hypothetical protein MTR67_008778 [Solanum verrucosum]|uniref:Uncharacterized protein n=1 Tax=Solanum verrucosum TaxID=315347 RepID=A0AAF0Q2W8_SOLVR|nr:hypothetical protein MTR67_008778 [Solanum verrucosum]
MKTVEECKIQPHIRTPTASGASLSSEQKQRKFTESSAALIHHSRPDQHLWSFELLERSKLLRRLVLFQPRF